MYLCTSLSHPNRLSRHDRHDVYSSSLSNKRVSCDAHTHYLLQQHCNPLQYFSYFGANLFQMYINILLNVAISSATYIHIYSTNFNIGTWKMRLPPDPQQGRSCLKINYLRFKNCTFHRHLRCVYI